MSVLIPKDIDVLSIDLTEHDKQIRVEVIAEISREIRLLYGNEYEKQIRAEVIAEIHNDLMLEIAELNEVEMNENNLITFAYRIKQIAEQLKEQK